MPTQIQITVTKPAEKQWYSAQDKVKDINKWICSYPGITSWSHHQLDENTWNKIYTFSDRATSLAFMDDYNEHPLQIERATYSKSNNFVTSVTIVDL